MKRRTSPSKAAVSCIVAYDRRNYTVHIFSVVIIIRLRRIKPTCFKRRGQFGLQKSSTVDTYRLDTLPDLTLHDFFHVHVLWRPIGNWPAGRSDPTHATALCWPASSLGQVGRIISG